MEEIMYVIEIYMDVENTLRQGIMYKYGDDKDRDFQRKKLNPHVTELIVKRYLNRDYEVISEKDFRKEEEE